MQPQLVALAWQPQVHALGLVAGEGALFCTKSGAKLQYESPYSSGAHKV